MTFHRRDPHHPTPAHHPQYLLEQQQDIVCSALILVNDNILGYSGISQAAILNLRTAFSEMKRCTVFLTSFIITSNLYYTFVVVEAIAGSEQLWNDIPQVSKCNWWTFDGLWDQDKKNTLAGRHEHDFAFGPLLC